MINMIKKADNAEKTDNTEKKNDKNDETNKCQPPHQRTCCNSFASVMRVSFTHIYSRKHCTVYFTAFFSVIGKRI